MSCLFFVCPLRLKIWLKYNKLMMDTGEIKDPDVGAGKLGLMSFSQERVIWSAVSAQCLGKHILSLPPTITVKIFESGADPGFFSEGVHSSLALLQHQ